MLLIAWMLAAEPLTPQRAWLERLALVIPGPTATRWLLLADAVCLVAVGLGARRPWVGLVVALGGGFVVINALGMVLNDFYLALATFHFIVAVATLVSSARRVRWLGAALVVAALVLGIFT